MKEPHLNNLTSAVFITFSGNCKQALSFYQSCFGGLLQFETFGKELNGYTEMPVVSGSLVSDSIIIYGSDLVHNEGRKLGNYISIFMGCKNTSYRKALIEKLGPDKMDFSVNGYASQKLVEITDAFGVRWILGI